MRCANCGNPKVKTIDQGYVCDYCNKARNHAEELRKWIINNCNSREEFVTNVFSVLEKDSEYQNIVNSYCDYLGYRHRKVFIDGYSYDSNNKKLILFIVDFELNCELANIITKCETESLLHQAYNFYDESINHDLRSHLDIDTNAHQLSEFIYRNFIDFCEVEFCVISSRLNRARSKIGLNIAENVQNFRISIVDAEKLFLVFKNIIRDRDDKQIDGLALIVKKHPDTLADRNRFKAILMDYVHDRGLCNMILFAYDEGIIEEINSEFDLIEKQRFIKKLTNNYGMSVDNAEIIINKWVTALQRW